MNRTIEDILLDRILYIGEQIPPALLEDERPKFILLGTPQQMIDELQED